MTDLKVTDQADRLSCRCATPSSVQVAHTNLFFFVVYAGRPGDRRATPCDRFD